MRLKACTKCGKFFRATKVEQRICEDCLAAEKSTTIRPRTCRECGTTFDGGPRAWYCPSCRAIRQKEADARRRKNGTIRPLGSIDHCTICGKEYIVKRLRLRHGRNPRPDSWELQAGTDGATFRTIASGKPEWTGDRWAEIDLVPVKARFIRIVLRYPDGKGGYLDEIELYGSEPPIRK